jgi:hypothetical protein
VHKLKKIQNKETLITQILSEKKKNLTQWTMQTAQFGLDGQEMCHQVLQPANVLHSYEYIPSEAMFPHFDVANLPPSYLTADVPRTLQNILQPSKTVRYFAALCHAALATCGTI